MNKLKSSLKRLSKSVAGTVALFLTSVVLVLFFIGSLTTETKINSTLNSSDTFKCATMEVYDRMIKQDPGYEKRLQDIEVFTKNYVKNFRGIKNTIPKIPVVVHIVYNTPEQNISNAVVQSQIDVLNIDYRRLNADTINTPIPFKPLGGDPQIEFVLAKRDPLGNPSIGITRTQTSVLTFEPNDYVKFTSLGGHDIWDRDKYLNIWICNLSFAGGYSQFPGGNPATDGNVMKYTIFGTVGAVIPGYTKGRIATHELGHWFNLRHIWGDANCGDDFVDDTPTAQTSNYSCPSFPHVTCNNGPNGDMFTDYMDYTIDDCKNIFSIGQCNRMNACLNGVRSSLLTSNGGIEVSGVPIAHFRSDRWLINIGQSINFFDESGGIPTSWQWTFDGGVPLTSNLKNPVVNYQNPGFYSVRLRVTNSHGTDSVNYINYVRVTGVNMSAFSLAYPLSNTYINISSSDTSRSIFTWNKSSLHPSIRYKWKIRRNGFAGEVTLNSNNNGTDSLISLRNSQLDSIASGFSGGGDTLFCLWRVYSYNGTDSLLSQNQFVVYLIRHTIGIQVISSSAPKEFKLYQNFPNPFNPTTKIKIDISSPLPPSNGELTRLLIYDILGREIATLVNEQLKPGTYEVDWDASNYPSGVYFYKLTTGEYTGGKRLILLK